MSRKKDIETLASLLGNSAAHVALLPDSEYAQKEATTYTTDAYEIAATRTFNRKEITTLREKAVRRAENEIRKRIKVYKFDIKKLPDFFTAAERYIDEFINEAIEKGYSRFKRKINKNANL